MNLAVIGRRSNGYHDLVSLMACVNLYDQITFQFEGDEIGICCPAPDVPEDMSNLACQAAACFREALIRQGMSAPFGLKMKLHKRIPVGAGLGGGSSDAAAVLKFLNRHFGDPFSATELAAMALSLGADVPFFLYGRPAIVSGIGERIEPYAGLTAYPLLIVFPGAFVSTAVVYGGLNLRLTKCEKKLKGFLLKRETFRVGDHMCNDLEAPAIQKCPDVVAVKSQLLDHGAEGALMTGSGSAVYGLFKNSDTALKARHALAAQSGWQIYEGRLLV